MSSTHGDPASSRGSATPPLLPVAARVGADHPQPGLRQGLDPAEPFPRRPVGAGRVQEYHGLRLGGPRLGGEVDLVVDLKTVARHYLGHGALPPRSTGRGA